MQIALVVDENGCLIGTITDGDIRRGLLKGLNLNSSIDSIIFRSPLVANISDKKEDIIKIALSKRIHVVPILDHYNKVVGIYDIEELIQPKIKPNKVVLMVGGLGTRLNQLTKDTPKPMLKVGNKPILHTIIDNFQEYGYSNFILCVNYKSHLIKDYFGNGEDFGVNIEYIEEKERLGTAGALGLIKDLPNEPFFVMNGDLLTKINFDHLHTYHIKNNSIATMCVRDYEYTIPYGVVNIEDSQIKNIEEKPKQTFFVNAGIYMLNSEVFKYIPENKYLDMTTLFEILIENKFDVFSFPIREYWLDIGRIEEYEKANNEFKKVF